MIGPNFSNLTGKILIATPFAMEGNIFHKSLIYVVKHTEEGSIGFIFNHPIKNAPADNMFKKIDDSINISDMNLEINIGGPVEVERGFFLHSAEYNKNLLFSTPECNLAISSNAEILRDISEGNGPERSMFTIGYTGWGPGQMEFELESNLWIIAEPDHDLIFSGDPTKKWSKALGMAGVAKGDFIPLMASC